MDKLARSAVPSSAAEAVRDNFRELVVILDLELTNGLGTASDVQSAIWKVHAAAQRGLELAEKLVTDLGLAP